MPLHTGTIKFTSIGQSTSSAVSLGDLGGSSSVPNITGVSNSKSASFDGTNDYIDISGYNLFNSNVSHTIAIWFKADTAETACLISMDDDGGWHENNIIYTTSDGVWGHYTANGALHTTHYDMVYAGNWHHAVFTVDQRESSKSTAILYIDGVFRSTSGAITSSANANACDLGNIGRYHLGGAGTHDPTNFSGQYRYFDGLIDEAAVWSTVLSSEAVKTIYNKGTPIDLNTNYNDYTWESSLTGWWRMEDSADDFSGQNHDGSVQGATFSTDVPQLVSDYLT